MSINKNNFFWVKAHRHINCPEQKAFLRLSLILKKTNYLHRKIFRKHKITTSQYNALSVISNFGKKGIRMNKIKEYLVIMNPDITRIIDKLEKLKYVQRQRSRNDRRVIKIKVTPAGEKLVKQIYAIEIESTKTSFSQLNSNEIENLNILLSKLLRENS